MDFMKRKRIALLLCTMFILFCGGCGEKDGEKEGENYPTVEINQPNESTSNLENLERTENPEQTDTDGVLTGDVDSVPDGALEKNPEQTISESIHFESIQDEIAEVEAKSYEYENAVWDSMSQLEMNQTTAQWYRLWDDELNSLWGRLTDELDAETKAEILEEQREWIKRKEQNIRGAGAEAFGGSLQPLLENSIAEEMTRARAYILAGYLAEARNETFTISSEIQESIDTADISINDVFEKFEGQWIFDKDRGACVGIERTETCAYGVEGSNWTVWVTGGDIISDLDVYGYTEDSILFKAAHDGHDAFYELSFNMDHSIYFAFGTSLDAMDEVIVCD